VEWVSVKALATNVMGGSGWVTGLTAGGGSTWRRRKPEEGIECRL
jgi:hypothetical protein